MWLSKLTNVFVNILKCVSSNGVGCCLFLLFLQPNPLAKRICPNFKIYFSKLQNVFVQMIKCFCLSGKIVGRDVAFFSCSSELAFSSRKIYLFKLQTIFVQISKCICPNVKMYLFQWQNSWAGCFLFLHFLRRGFFPGCGQGGKWFTRDQRGQEVANYCATVSTELLSLCNRVNRIIIIVQPCQQNYYHYATVSTEFPDSIKK